MKSPMWAYIRVLSLFFMAPFLTAARESETIALWLFDEPAGLYPSSVLDDQSENDYPMVIGPGGTLVPGKFGNALATTPQPPVQLPEGPALFGLEPAPMREGRTVEPMNWMNAKFCALMTRGENHLRKEVGFANATDTRLNLGALDWTVEFWFRASDPSDSGGIVFEIGRGPRGENNHVTQLRLNADRSSFTLVNQPGGVSLNIPSAERDLRPENTVWRHFAFVYDRRQKQLHHFVDGREQKLPPKSSLKELPTGPESYFSVGRDGAWKHPLQGRMDELRFSTGRVYVRDFEPPESFAPPLPQARLTSGPPLLFDKEWKPGDIVPIGDRKHLFIDDALLDEVIDCEFTVNPPRRAEKVIDNIAGPYRKHLTVVEDEDGLIRIYNSIHKDYLAVRTSRDGVTFEIPDTGHGTIEGQKNIVIPEMVGGLGNPFIDPNGPTEHRWKYLSGYHRRAIYLYTSPDGYRWKRQNTSILPFRSGTQSCTFYDDQRQRYVSYHRSGIFHTPAMATRRSSVVVEHENLFQPLEFTPLTQEEYLVLREEYPLRDPLPWYLDNSPLTPGGFGMEFPHRFDPIPEDPAGVDFYVTKAQKYEWAPDTYVAFPIAYFHYELDGPKARQVLLDKERGRGSGPLETQFEVSRDGLNWQRFPRPAYVGIGPHAGRNVVTAYIAHGMVRRGGEIWQYYFGETQYHSAWTSDEPGRAVYRLVQRLDGFVSIDSPYDREGRVITKPLIFEGNRLTLNVDTDGAGYAQVGFLDMEGKPIEGFSVDECVYINGDFIAEEAEWMGTGKDVSALQGRPVRLVFRMRGSKLYAMQFVNRS